jgi:hypothetical protein
LILLADNDIILKLAQCDLLTDLPDLLREDADQIFITPTARYQLLPKKTAKAIEKCGNEVTVKRIRDFLDKAMEIPPIQDDSLLKTLASIDKIDGGESILFAAAVQVPNPILATGDRNALRALLAHQEQLPTVIVALRERVVTFESVILLALYKRGFAIIKQKLLNSPKPDKMLSLVLKSDMRESDLIDCLRSYSREIEPLLLFRNFLFLSPCQRREGEGQVIEFPAPPTRKRGGE